MTRNADLVLDEQRPDGVRAVRRHVSPPLDVVAVQETSTVALARAVGRLCQLWGGAKYLLVPATPEGVPDSEWMAALRSPSGHVFKALDIAVEGKAAGDPLPGWTGEPLLGLVVGELGDGPKPRVKAALPRPDDPWYQAYVGTLGLLPEKPDPEVLDRARLIPSLEFDQLLDVDRSVIVEPSAKDLLERVSDRTTSCPRLATLWHLVPNAVAWRSSLRGYLPASDPVPLEAGPRILVVYEPGSVRDVCLLWNLRSIHGEPYGFPLGAPVTDPGWEEAYATSANRPAFPLPAAVVLTSCSVSLAQLEEVAARHARWSVATPARLLQPPVRASRPSQDVAVFAKGASTLAVLSGNDRDLLRRSSSTHFSLTSTFELLDRRLPPIAKLRREHSASGFGETGFEVDVRGLDDMTEIEWPSGWKVLESAVSDRGLVAVPSAPGRAAMAMLDRLGGIEGVDYLLSNSLLQAVYRLCELRSMSWFRARVRDLQTELRASSVDFEALATKVGAIASRAVDDDRAGATLDDFKKTFGGQLEAARAWIGWAEGRSLLTRGTPIRCDHCQARQWRAIGELSPGIVCRSCGKTMGQPFPHDQLRFAYRPSQPLLSAVEFDALAHLFPLRWFTKLLNPWPSPRGELYGVHPGLELRSNDGQVVAEIDALLLLSNGDLIPGEVKRSGRGLTQGDINQLDRACKLLSSPWSFVATPDRASNCTDLWAASRREESPERFVLTGEHLLDAFVHWTLGTDPFAWRVDSDEEWTTRDKAFASNLPDRAAWDQEERVPGRWDL